MKKLTVIFAAVLIMNFALTNLSVSQVICGKQRWNVKTLTDKDTVKINFNKVIKSSVHKQVKMKNTVKITKNLPRLKSETKVYQIEANVIRFKTEDDRDYHVVISDPKTGESMVIEIPDPECPGIQNTSRYSELKKVRDWFKAEFNPTTGFKHTAVKVRLTGVGFFDFVHGQNGMAANGREIHPVLKMEKVSD